MQGADLAHADLQGPVFSSSTTCRWSLRRIRSRIRRSGMACTRRRAPSARRAEVCRSSASIPLAATRASFDVFRASWRAAWGDAPLPLMGLGRFVVVADTDAAALAIARRAYPRWYDSFTHVRHRKHGRPNAHPRPATFDGLAEVGQGVAGSPATVAAFLRRELGEHRQQLLRWPVRVRRSLACRDASLDRAVRARRHARIGWAGIAGGRLIAGSAI